MIHKKRDGFLALTNDYMLRSPSSRCSTVMQWNHGSFTRHQQRAIYDNNTADIVYDGEYGSRIDLALETVNHNMQSSDWVEGFYDLKNLMFLGFELCFFFQFLLCFFNVKNCLFMCLYFFILKKSLFNFDRIYANFLGWNICYW